MPTAHPTGCSVSECAAMPNHDQIDASQDAQMNNAEFTLHDRLAADGRLLGDLLLCRVLLIDDSRFPWCVLVPRQPGLRELHDLADADGKTLLAEINAVSKALLEACPEVSKLNVGTLGNLVPQLHIHVVGRHPGDAAWPGPVWGSGSAIRGDANVATLAERLRRALC